MGYAIPIRPPAFARQLLETYGLSAKPIPPFPTASATELDLRELLFGSWKTTEWETDMSKAKLTKTVVDRAEPREREYDPALECQFRYFFGREEFSYVRLTLAGMQYLGCILSEFRNEDLALNSVPQHVFFKPER